MENQLFAEAQKKCLELANLIEKKQESLFSILSAYESYTVFKDEVERSVSCLRNIKTEKKYFGARVKTISVFFPQNLPLYSTIIFSIVSSFFSNKLYVRPPVLMHGVMRKMVKELELSKTFPSVIFSYLSREEFLEHDVIPADVVIFTGTYKNAMKIFSKLSLQSLFLYNGAGLNPLVVTKSADIEKAVDKTIEVKTFNCGQDCAGPDAILVHEKRVKEFIELLQKKVAKLPIGDYKNKETIIGKLIDPKHAKDVEKMLSEYNKNVVYGGNRDIEKGIIYPTIIVKPLLEGTNFKEFFAPIFFINTYKNDAELDLYFKTPEYQSYMMYVSIFGSSEYIKNLGKSIVLQDKIILDVEQGNKEFGGYGPRASFVALGDIYKSHPILISREIHEFTKNRKDT